jgi:hypothetical protein
MGRLTEDKIEELLYRAGQEAVNTRLGGGFGLLLERKAPLPYVS